MTDETPKADSGPETDQELAPEQVTAEEDSREIQLVTVNGE